MNLLALGLVFSGTSPLIATDIMLLRREAREVQGESHCTGQFQIDPTWFERKYGKRFRRVSEWFEAHFDPGSLADAQGAVDGDDVSLGDCHFNSQGRQVSLAEKEFARRLQTLERRIVRGAKTYP